MPLDGSRAERSGPQNGRRAAHLLRRAELASARLAARGFPTTPDEVGRKLTEKILLAERKTAAVSDGVVRASRPTQEQVQELYALCAAAVRGEGHRAASDTEAAECEPAAEMEAA
ncbi:hypothetical protein [Roseomonas chloroacetimidivorans]|uniref:hypothetical protein n=1 Tax=Roseomonas chloroacetimidivorans TaxID=1766656 RepID=UPI003C787440